MVRSHYDGLRDGLVNFIRQIISEATEDDIAFSYSSLEEMMSWILSATREVRIYPEFSNDYLTERN